MNRLPVRALSILALAVLIAFSAFSAVYSFTLGSVMFDAADRSYGGIFRLVDRLLHFLHLGPLLSVVLIIIALYAIWRVLKGGDSPRFTRRFILFLLIFLAFSALLLNSFISVRSVVESTSPDLLAQLL